MKSRERVISHLYISTCRCLLCMKQTQVRPKREKATASLSLSVCLSVSMSLIILSRLTLSVVTSFSCLPLDAPPPGLVIDPPKGNSQAYQFSPVFTVRPSRSLASHLRVASNKHKP